ncbi:MAG: MarR family transcriptional regulator [Ferruginibacter sp.]
MSLEKDISQSSFRNDFQKGIINLIYTYNWMNEKMKAVFDKEGITGQQYNILRILRGAGKPISTLQIRERMLDKMSDTSRIVDRLVLKGLAQKNTCKNDKRLVDVSITGKGRKLLEKIDRYEKDMDAILGNLTDAEAKTLNKLLDKIRQSD